MHELMQELMIENARLKERCALLEESVKAKTRDYDRLLDAFQNLTIPSIPLQPIKYPAPPYTKGCSKCGIGADGGPLGYVCNDPMCPCGLGGAWCSTNTTR